MFGGHLLEQGVHGYGLFDLERLEKVLVVTRHYLVDAMHIILFEDLELLLNCPKKIPML